MTRRFEHRLRVRYHECDLQGVVFNAHYLAYFDIALTEFMRATLGSYQALRAAGSDLLVIDARLRFRAPAHFDDELALAFLPRSLGGSSMVSGIEVHRGQQLLVEGEMVHVFVDVTTQVKQPVPADIRERLSPWLAASPPAS